MKTILFIIFMLVIWQNAIVYGQNLVPNPSFEEYDTCPNDFAQIYFAKYWSSFGYSPDYYNSCNTSGQFSIPNNIFGYQYPAEGNAYAGLIPYIEGIFGREFMGAQLLSPLIIGQKYDVSFKVSATTHSIDPEACIAIDKMGMKFSTISYLGWPYVYENNLALINNYAQIYSTTIITDTSNWITIMGSFIADSAYKYVIIGNFFDDEHTDTLHINIVTNPSTPTHRAYYYIDNVIVTKDSLDGIIEENDANGIILYPNPSNNIVSLNFKKRYCNFSIQIYNIVGEELDNSIFDDHLNFLNFTNYPRGVYFLNIKTNEFKTTKKIIIN